MTEYEKMVAGEWIATDDAEIVRHNPAVVKRRNPANQL